MKTYPLAVVVFFSLSITLLAVLPGQGLSAADQNLVERLNQLEAETQALRSEVGRMRQDVVRLPGVASSAAGNSVVLVSDTYESAAPAPPVPWAVPLSTASQPAGPKSSEQSPVRPLPPVTQTATSPTPAPAPEAPSPPAPQPSEPQSAAPQEDYYTLDQIKGEMKKLVWKKGDTHLPLMMSLTCRMNSCVSRK